MIGQIHDPDRMRATAAVISPVAGLVPRWDEGRREFFMSDAAAIRRVGAAEARGIGSASGRPPSRPMVQSRRYVVGRWFGPTRRPRDDHRASSRELGPGRDGTLTV